MLLREDFRRCHQCTLEAATDHDEHANKCDNGFSASHISLQQPAHLAARTHVGVNLFNDSLLGASQLKRQVIIVKLSDERRIIKYNALELLLADKLEL